MKTVPTEGYSVMHGDEKDVANTAVAAFVIAMNTLRALRASGAILPGDFNAIVENAVAVANPRDGSGVRNHLYGNLTDESRDRQDRHYYEPE